MEKGFTANSGGSSHEADLVLKIGREKDFSNPRRLAAESLVTEHL